MPAWIAATSPEESGFRQSTPVASPAKPCPSCLIDMLKTALQSYCGSPRAPSDFNQSRRQRRSVASLVAAEYRVGLAGPSRPPPQAAVWVCRPSIASAFGGERPADPVAQRLAHHEVEIAALQPRQFLGKQGHALPPGAEHAGDVGAPEHPLGTEGVEAAVQMRMQASEWIVVLGVARLAGRLDHDVRVRGERQQLRLEAI